jgi:hypothetical protein
MVQFLCIVVTVIADPLLVPWFQQHTGNGGLGANLTTAATELLMLVAGIKLMPRGIVDRPLLRTAGLTAVAGAAMVGVAWLLLPVTLWLAAPVSVLAYVGALFGTGVLDKQQVALLRSLLKRRTTA